MVKLKLKYNLLMLLVMTTIVAVDDGTLLIIYVTLVKMWSSVKKVAISEAVKQVNKHSQMVT